MVDTSEQPKPDQAQIRRQEIRLRLERERRELFPSGNSTLDQCEIFAGAGNRVYVQSQNPELIQEMHTKYGDNSVLAQNTRDWVEVIDEGQMSGLAELINRVASEVKGQVVDGSIPVLDNKGPDGAVRAYLWPYMGVSVGSEEITAYPPKGAKDLLKQGCQQIGIDEIKVTDIELNPGAQSQRAARTVVFIGKT